MYLGTVPFPFPAKAFAQAEHGACAGNPSSSLEDDDWAAVGEEEPGCRACKPGE